MSEFIRLESSLSATLGAVVDVVTRISTLGEATILEMVAAGNIQDLFPFRTSAVETPPDTVAEHELVEASASPLSRERQAALIQASMPSTSARPRKRKQSYSEG